MGKHEKKQSDRLSWSVEHTDRGDLLDAAQGVIRLMALARRLDHIGEGMCGSDPELMESERAAYESALRFVVRELEKGPRETKTHLTESNTEYEMTCEGSEDEKGGEGVVARDERDDA